MQLLCIGVGDKVGVLVGVRVETDVGVLVGIGVETDVGVLVGVVVGVLVAPMIFTCQEVENVSDVPALFG